MAARASFGLPYFHAQMSMEGENEIAYRTRRTNGGVEHFVRYRLGGPMAKGELEHFLVERYVLFVKRGGKIPACTADGRYCRLRRP